MVSNSTQLDRRTKQHTQLESLRVTVAEIWPGQNRGKIVAEKNKKQKQSELDGKQQYKIRLQNQAAHLIWSLCE